MSSRFQVGDLVRWETAKHWGPCILQRDIDGDHPCVEGGCTVASGRFKESRILAIDTLELVGSKYNWRIFFCQYPENWTVVERDGQRLTSDNVQTLPSPTLDRCQYDGVSYRVHGVESGQLDPGRFSSRAAYWAPIQEQEALVVREVLSACKRRLRTLPVCRHTGAQVGLDCMTALDEVIPVYRCAACWPA